MAGISMQNMKMVHWYIIPFPTPPAVYYIYIYAFSRRFYPKRLTVHSGYTFFVSMCVSWEINPQPLHF